MQISLPLSEMFHRDFNKSSKQNEVLHTMNNKRSGNINFNFEFMILDRQNKFIEKKYQKRNVINLVINHESERRDDVREMRSDKKGRARENNFT